MMAGVPPPPTQVMGHSHRATETSQGFATFGASKLSRAATAKLGIWRSFSYSPCNSWACAQCPKRCKPAVRTIASNGSPAAVPAVGPWAANSR